MATVWVLKIGYGRVYYLSHQMYCIGSPQPNNHSFSGHSKLKWH